MTQSKWTRRSFLASGAVAAATWVMGRAPEQQPAGSFVEFVWSGAVTAASARVKAKIDHDSTAVRLHISPTTNLSGALLSDWAVADTAVNNRVANLTINNLQADTQYYYAIEADGLLDNTIGKLHTPAVGAYSFTFAFSSCADTNSNHPVFETIRQHNPLFYLNLGDLHYRDIPVNDRDLFRQGYEAVLAASSQAALYRDVPFVYMWDDHDYGPNDGDATAPGREAARLVYQEYVPHYPLLLGSGDVPIYQAFTVGRVRLVLTDTRSLRDTKAVDVDDPNKSMLGAAQKAWLKQEFLQAQGVYPLLIWVSPSPWIADPPGAGIDNWNGFRAERREIADFLEANEIRNVLMVSGDVHMLAIDNGRNNTYASSGKPNFPIMQASALDRPNPTYLPDNTYSEGQYPGSGQFGLVTITDDGGDVVTVLLNGRNHLNANIVSLTLTMPQPPQFLLEPESFSFISYADDDASISQILTIVDCADETLTWSITVDPPVPWLTISPDSGTATAVQPAVVTLTADPTGLSLGFYQTTVYVQADPPHSTTHALPLHFLCTDQPPTYLPLIAKEAAS
jgi:alkaline phosphatase D